MRRLLKLQPAAGSTSQLRNKEDLFSAVSCETLRHLQHIHLLMEDLADTQGEEMTF